MHDETSHHHGQPSSDAQRCEAATHIIDTLGLCGLIALTKATPQHLLPLMKSLLDASTQEEFFRLRQDAVREYASLSAAKKRELIGRLCTALPPDALKELGKILDPPSPESAAHHAHPNTIQFSKTLGTCMDDVLHALGPELAGQLATIFEAETQEALEHALDQFSDALKAAPDRAGAAAEEPGLHLVRATLRLVARNPRTVPPPVRRLAKLKTRLALARQSLRGGVLGGAMGLAAPPLLATAGALFPFLAHAFRKFPPELQSELHTRLQTLQSQCSPLGWFR